MTTRKRKDDEMLIWLIVGGIFTLFLIGIDIWYSSYSQMALMGRTALYIAHAFLAGLWAIAMKKFDDPNYEVVRKYIVYVAVIISLTIGIHHALNVEDKQVLIDSHENATKDSAK